MANSRLEIDLAAIQRNVGILRQITAASPAADPASRRHPVGLCAVIKQDAYGLGAARIAKKLASLNAEMLAVYSLEEARELADTPILTPLLILAPVRAIERQDPAYRLVVRSRLHLTVHDLPQVAELANVASRLGTKIPVHVQLDTGLSRGGALPDEASKIVEAIAANQRLSLAGVLTHFSSPASDDAFTREQAKSFRAWIDSVKPILAATPGVAIHAANTAATLRGRHLHASMVRVGQGLYGYGIDAFTDPLAVEFASFGNQLQPALRWVSRITHLKDIPKGTAVGYGRTFKTLRPTRLALVPVGYADGYTPALANVAKVGLNGLAWDRPRVGTGEPPEPAEKIAYAPVVGRVSMDQITIDVSGLPDKLARIGAEVELIGRDAKAPNHLPTLAKAAGTITHDLLCRLSTRIERIYQARAQDDLAPPLDAPPAPTVTLHPAAHALTSAH